ncbi:hypothetical protein LGM38_17440 [Burkholderia vietnamiensis]|uniref:hypothetical protein n=1 Tax=Burkholderia vietnamiensis TaxID=60552 RepID=UPI001CF16C71|nr:hypothetical protein [Burkholderia vietnamiensis]MCA8013834.1 hypothetical protein [Burkholderia vietnamiensis]
MGQLQKIALGNPPKGSDGDSNRVAHVKANENVDVLEAQVALTSAPHILTSQTLTDAHIGKRVSISIAAGGTVKLKNASTCAPDSLVWLVNVGAKSTNIAPNDGSGDTVSLSVLGPGEAAVLDSDGVSAWRTLMRGRTAGVSESVVSDLDVGGALTVKGLIKPSDAGIQFPDGSIQGGAPAGKNRLINGSMRVAQRGAVTCAANATTYGTADRFYVSVTGAAVGSSLIAGPKGFTSAMSISGTLGNTGVTVGQRIESRNIGDLAAQTVTFSGWVFSSGGSAPVVAVGTPPSADNFAAVNWGPTSALPNLTPNTWTFVKCTTLMPAGAVNGAAVEMRFGAVTSGASVAVTGFQLEAGATATPFERTEFAEDLRTCQRYYEVLAPYFIQLGGYGLGGNVFPFSIPFKMTKRVPPMFGFGPSAVNNCGFNSPGASVDGASLSVSVSNTGPWTCQITGTSVASAEL